MSLLVAVLVAWLLASLFFWAIWAVCVGGGER